MTEAGYDQNEQVKRISSWAAIFFAPSFVASVYGMNFKTDARAGLAAGLSLRAAAHGVAVAGALYVAFKRKGWL